MYLLLSFCPESIFIYRSEKHDIIKLSKGKRPQLKQKQGGIHNDKGKQNQGNHRCNAVFQEGRIPQGGTASRISRITEGAD